MRLPVPGRYRIDEQGGLWQEVQTGRRTSRGGLRRMGRVVRIVPSGSSWRISYVTLWQMDALPVGDVVVHRDHLVAPRDEAGRPIVPPLWPPISGGAEDTPGPAPKVPPQAYLRLETLDDGSKLYEVVCGVCGADISRVSLGRLVATPEGFSAEVWHPVRCPDCQARLLRVPSAARVIRPRGTVS